MKFSVLRSKERKSKKDLERLLKKLSTLNPNGTFKVKETNPSHICSGLNLDDLANLSLPVGTAFIQNPLFSAREYGFVLVSYKNKEYSVFGKGFEGSYFII